MQPPSLVNIILDNISEYSFEKQYLFLESAANINKLELLKPEILGNKILLIFFNMLNDPKCSDPGLQNMLARKIIFHREVRGHGVNFSCVNGLLTNQSFEAMCQAIAEEKRSNPKIIDLRDCLVFAPYKKKKSSLFKLNSLKSLLLGGSDIDNCQLKNLSQMSALTNLDLSDCNIQNKNLSVLSSLPKLRKLNLSYSKITKFDLSLLQTRLRELHLMTKTKLSLKGKQHLIQLTNLKCLSLMGISNFTDDDLAVMKEASIKELCLSNCYPLTTSGVNQITQFTDLRILNLVGQSAGASALCEIGKLTSLRRLGLSCGTLFSKRGLRNLHLEPGDYNHLSKLTNLNHLTLQTHATSIRNCTGALASLPKLRSLEFFNCLRLSNEVIASISECSRLNKLYIHNAPLITNSVLKDISMLTGLTVLHLTGINCKTDPIPAQDLVNLTRLKSFKIEPN
jgi:hypothetical protein